MEMIIFQAPIEKVYKILILWSKTEGFIKQSYYTSILKEIISSYGFREVSRLDKMTKEGLIEVGGSVIKFTSSPFIQQTNVTILLLTLRISI